MGETANKTRDRWDKLEIIFKSAGGILTAVTVALIGIFGSIALARRQDTETNVRLYTELMSKREEADTLLRKEMFNSIITNFLKPGSSKQLDKMILNLELLAYNFHDSLDLGPLFKDVYKRLDRNPRSEQDQQNYNRLVKLTRDVIDKQVTMLVEAGAKLDGVINFNELKEKPAGVIVIDEYISIKAEAGGPSSVIKKKVRVEALDFDPKKQELLVRLRLWSPQNNDEAEADVLFWVGFFDFPMLDNVLLPQGNRCSIVLREFENEYAEITVVHFPGSRASLKEKPFYDEILYKLRNQQQP